MIRGGLSSRVSKVNDQLQKLANIMADNTKIYFQAKQALAGFHSDSCSSQSEEYEFTQPNFQDSNAFSKKSRILSNNSANQTESMLFSNLVRGCQKQVSKYEPLSYCTEFVNKNGDIVSTDMTVKKFKSPQRKQLEKKKKQSMERDGKKNMKQKSKIKQKNSKHKLTCKVKSPKSESKVQHYTSTNIDHKHDIHNKYQTLLRKTKKKTHHQQHQQQQQHQQHQQHQHQQSNKILKKSNIHPQSYKTTSNIHPLSISMFPEHNTKTMAKFQKSDPNYPHQKIQLNLKKQVTMKISDLNMQKQLCQKESEYLKAAMRFSEEKLREICGKLRNSVEKDILIKCFIMKTLVKFLMQFFIPEEFRNINLDSVSQDITIQQLTLILSNVNFLKYMLKLPTILNQNNTLSERNCAQLFQQKRFIERKLTEIKQLQHDIIVCYFNNLYEYISFLLNNNLVHETKRRYIPFEFNSERSQRQRLSKALLQSLLDKNQQIKQYDSERRRQMRSHDKPINLKRTKTYKTLSKNTSNSKNNPKNKIAISNNNKL